jgi:hypothetical protein
MTEAEAKEKYCPLRSNCVELYYKCHAASMIAGPFFSRKSAQDTLDATRYNYGKNAVVFCASGTYSKDFVDLYKSSLELRKERGI